MSQNQRCDKYREVLSQQKRIAETMNDLLRFRSQWTPADREQYAQCVHDHQNYAEWLRELGQAGEAQS